MAKFPLGSLFSYQMIFYVLLGCCFTACHTNKYLADDSEDYYEPETVNHVFGQSASVKESKSIDKPPMRPGVCYAKCLRLDCDTKRRIEYFEYTGDPEAEDVILEERTFVIQEGTTKWVKKKADRNCLSANPDDCLVWCLVKFPELIETKMVLVDTSQTHDFELAYMDIQTDQNIAGRREWVEVICENKIDKTVATELSQTLSDLGYLDPGKVSGKITPNVKVALKKYQSDNCLGQGPLSFESLHHLNIDYMH